MPASARVATAGACMPMAQNTRIIAVAPRWLLHHETLNHRWHNRKRSFIYRALSVSGANRCQLNCAYAPQNSIDRDTGASWLPFENDDTDLWSVKTTSQMDTLAFRRNTGQRTKRMSGLSASRLEDMLYA